jgi:hypothetical protein
VVVVVVVVVVMVLAEVIGTSVGPFLPNQSNGTQSNGGFVRSAQVREGEMS